MQLLKITLIIVCFTFFLSSCSIFKRDCDCPRVEVQEEDEYFITQKQNQEKWQTEN